ncbi:MAG: serine/threonine protein kinase [Planctomycetia bacterium]|nr:serine/threonine protein kinase [Planctomycetia bacterium]
MDNLETRSTVGLPKNGPEAVSSQRYDTIAYEHPTYTLESTFASRTDPDRYLIREELARGGMGTIYIAWDKLFGRLVALKSIHDKVDNQLLKSRFLTEARITAQLQHSSIPPVYDLGMLADGRPFMAMKLIRGKPWNRILNVGPITDQHLLKSLVIFLQVCKTVGYAHANGIIHRDLKPANIMLSDDGEVHVMDWGLAKRLNIETTGDNDSNDTGDVLSAFTPMAETRYGEVLGTLAYMAPEQGRGDVNLVDRRADVFSLGAILCEILTGEPMRPRSQPGEQLREIREGNLDRAFANLDRKEIDQKLVRITWSCLATEPESRPRDANELAEEVQDYLYGLDGTNEVVQDAILRAREFDRYKIEKLKADVLKLQNELREIQVQGIENIQKRYRVRPINWDRPSGNRSHSDE